MRAGAVPDPRIGWPMDGTAMLAAVEAIAEGVVITGVDRRIVYINPAFCQITGYAPDEVIGRSCAFLQGQDSDPLAIAAIARGLDSGEGYSGPILNYRRDGTSFWNDLTILPTRDGAGRISGYFGITRDTSAQRKLQADYAALESQGQYLLDHAQAGIVLHRANTEIVYANRLARELLGVPTDNIIGAVNTDPRWGFLRDDGSVMPIEEYPVNAAVRRREIVRELVIGQRFPGTDHVQWRMCTAYPKLDEEGNATHVLVTFTDVTRLKQAEQALRKSEERLRLVLRGTNDAAWDWDLVSGERYFSPRWWEMLGHSASDFADDADVLRQLMHPRDRLAMAKVLERTLAGRATDYEVEFRLRHKQGRYVPVLSRGFVLRDAEGRAVRLSGTNTDLTERKRAEKEIRKLAYYDGLTGLPNRQLLMDLLQAAVSASQRTQQRGVVMFIDLDDFKIFNDTQGHAAGDMLLRKVARRLRDCVRAGDVVSRLGGDEFVVLLQGLGEDAQEALLIAEGVARNLHRALTRPFRMGRIVHHCTLSIGIAPFEDVPMAADSVLRHADLAMYQAKAAGRNTLRFFDQDMQHAADERLALENDLRHALGSAQVFVAAQPQQDAEGRLVGAELLLRWRSPKRGMVSPAAFIPVAEATGLIVALGRWVLEAACRTLAAWAGDPLLSQVSLSVNVSVREFSDAEFLSRTLALLQQERIPAGRLKVEVTESLLAADIDLVIGKMAALRAAGVRLSIDDFGTGYSSLAYLRRMPLDEIKIDRSFVAQCLTSAGDASIVQIILSLAQNLGLSVVAEGVETEAQREFLRARGCGYFQGYLLGKPMSLQEFEAQVRAAAGA